MCVCVWFCCVVGEGVGECVDECQLRTVARQGSSAVMAGEATKADEV